MATRKQDPGRQSLSSLGRKTQEALLRHPAPQDLLWGDVVALLGELAEVREGRKGAFQVTRRGVMTTLKAPRLRAALTAAEVGEVRQFLERSAEGVSTPVVAEGTRLLVALDASGARIYRLEGPAGPPQGLVPFEGNGYSSTLRTTLPGKTAQPVRLAFVKEFARALRGAEEVLLVADGPDGPVAVEALRQELRRDHPDTYRVLLGPVALPGRRSAAEAHLLECARAFYASRR